MTKGEVEAYEEGYAAAMADVDAARTHWDLASPGRTAKVYLALGIVIGWFLFALVG